MEIFSGKRVFPELTRSAVTFSKTADFVHFVMPARCAPALQNGQSRIRVIRLNMT
jgi:hypothetical protein